MGQCQIELRQAGKAYPRTCPTCGLSGACVKGLKAGAPERIWAWEYDVVELTPDDDLEVTVSNVAIWSDRDPQPMLAAEYIRADVARAEAEAMRRAEREG